MPRKRQKIAVLQLVPKHQNMLPNQLVRALSLLEYHQSGYSVYDLEAPRDVSAAEAITSVFSKISEDIVIVSLSCHYNYPKLTSLALLFMYQEFLSGKEVHVCSPYLSFYPVGQLRRRKVFFHFVEIDEFLLSYLGLSPVADQRLLKSMADVLCEQNYKGREFWTHLTWGCRSACQFCHNWATVKGNRRLLYSGYDKVISSMQTARALGARKFQFADPDFLGDEAYVSGFLDKLAHGGSLLPWRAKVRLDRINEGLYAKMLSAGCDRIFFGVEHVSSRLLKIVNKGADTPRLLLDFIKYWGAGVQLDVSFLTGIRGETVSELEENISYISRLSRIKGVEAYLGYVILYFESARKKAFSSDLVGLLLACNMLPDDWRIDQSFLRRLFCLCRQEPFFGFFVLTQNARSLALFQQLLRQHQTEQAEGFLSDFGRLWALADGRVAGIVSEAKTLRETNRKIEQWILK